MKASFISESHALYSTRDLATVPHRSYVYMHGTSGRDVIVRHRATFLQYDIVMSFVYVALNAYLEVIA